MIDNIEINIGTPAPNFELPDQDGNMVSLASLKGKPIVIYFYPKDFTPGCTQEACDFRDNYEPIKNMGVTVLGISPDDAESHTKFRAEHKLPFQLLADVNNKTSKRYGAWGKKNVMGNEVIGLIRSTFIIDAQGKIFKVWHNVNVEGHIEEVINELNKLSGVTDG